MVTGIEAAGLALAILPLVVNQLDNYALGLEKIKLFRKYKVQLLDYAAELGTQRTILLNTLLKCLEGVVDDHDQRADLISNPKGPGWKDPDLEDQLRDKLGQSYEPFKGTVNSLCNHLEYLSHKLGAEAPDPSVAPTKPMKSMKFRKILSSAVYKDLLEKIDKTNQTLKTLIDQSQDLEQTRRGSSYRQRKSLKRHREQRKHARELYRIMIQEKRCWSCACQDTHVIGIELGSHQFEPQVSSSFRVMLSSANKSSKSQARRWGEVEFEAHQSQCSTYEGHCMCSTLQQANGKSKVRFSASYCTQSVHLARRGQQVDNICAALHQDRLKNAGSQIDNTTYISDGITADIRYYINRINSSQDDIHLHSLKEIFQMASSSSSSAASNQNLGEFGYYMHDALYLATVLACSVLHFHGTWLETHWSTQDILFLRTDKTQKPQYQQPYILRKVSGQELNKGHELGRLSNGILFPLAVALIELSLGKCISDERLDKDEGASEHETVLNTATRVLESKVLKQSGYDYVNVVKQCLNWTQGPRRGLNFEDPHFDESVFDLVIYPLIKYFDHFSGVTSSV